MIKKLNRGCPICGNENGKVLGNVKMVLGNDMKLPEEYDITACMFCGFVYADVNASQDDYNEYYENNNCYADVGEIRSVTNSTKSTAIADSISKYVTVDESILDVGFGSGELLIELKNRGYKNLSGIDPSQSSVDRITEYGIHGIKKNVFDSWEGKYDVIVFISVLEHIYDINRCMNIILGHLVEKGKIFISVPAVEGYEKYYQSKPNYFNHEHINHFSKVSLVNFMGSHSCKSLSEDKGWYHVMELMSGKQMSLRNIFIYDKSFKHQIEKDVISEKSVVEYLRQYEKEEERLNELTAKLQERRKNKCIVWGAGSLSMQLMVNEDFACNVMFFVDNNQSKVGKEIRGKKIYFPDILHEKKYADIPILIACMNYKDDIVKQIKAMNINNDIIVY